jgi:hypothetical protein
LNGPPELIDRIERSLFARGVITARIEADAALNAGVAEAIIASKVLSGMVALVITPDSGGTLTARAGNEQIALDASGADEAIAAVHELLARAGILVSQGNVDWEI